MTRKSQTRCDQESCDDWRWSKVASYSRSSFFYKARKNKRIEHRLKYDWKLHQHVSSPILLLLDLQSVFFQNHRINFFVLEVRSMPRSAAGQCSRGYRTLLPQQCRVKTIQARTKQIQSNSSTHVCVWPNSRPKQQDWLQPKNLGTLPSLMFSKEVGARWN